MIPNLKTRIYTRISALSLSLAMIAPSQALTPGAWETFSTQTNADAWTVYAYYYDEEAMVWEYDFFYPEWNNDDDPFIGFSLRSESANFYADASVASGAFTGDYAAADVEWITMDVAISDTTLIDYYDVSILSDVGGVERFYYTDSYSVETFEDGVWKPQAFALDDPWYYWDPSGGEGGDGDWVEVTLSDTVLSNITEIGITFFHVTGNTTATDVRIDNVALSHPLRTPDLAISATAGMATLSFQPMPAHVYDLQKFNVTTKTWDPLNGQSSIMGPDPFTFSEPLAGNGMFRCVAYPYYTEVVTSP